MIHHEIIELSGWFAGFLHPPDYKTWDLGKRSLWVATGKDADMARKDNAVPFLCRCDSEVILLYERNCSLILFGEENSMTNA